MLTISAASEFFTQDLDDFAEESGPTQDAKKASKKGKDQAGKPQGKKASSSPTNQSGGSCSECNAPAGKPHATSCSARKQAAEENKDQTPEHQEENKNQDRCQACFIDGGRHADGCPNDTPIEAEFPAPEGDEV